MRLSVIAASWFFLRSSLPFCLAPLKGCGGAVCAYRSTLEASQNYMHAHLHSYYIEMHMCKHFIDLHIVTYVELQAGATPTCIQVQIVFFNCSLSVCNDLLGI